MQGTQEQTMIDILTTHLIANFWTPNGTVTGWRILKDKWFPLQGQKLNTEAQVLHRIMSECPAKLEAGRMKVYYGGDWCDMNMYVAD